MSIISHFPQGGGVKGACDKATFEAGVLKLTKGSNYLTTPGASLGDAVADDCAAGKSFTSAAGLKMNGTLQYFPYKQNYDDYCCEYTEEELNKNSILFDIYQYIGRIYSYIIIQYSIDSMPGMPTKIIVPLFAFWEKEVWINVESPDSGSYTGVPDVGLCLDVIDFRGNMCTIRIRAAGSDSIASKKVTKATILVSYGPDR